MPKINQEEYEILISLDERAKSIVRQDGGRLWVAEQPIMKDDIGWYVEDGFDVELEDDEVHLFQFIQWEDEEPYDIAELIEEYEYHNEPVKLAGGLSITQAKYDKYLEEHIKELENESEETEVKNIEWLKKWTYEYEDEIDGWLGDKHTGDYFSTRLHGGLSAIKEIREKLNQLDEPEVLSQEFINEKAVEVYADTADAEVHVVYRMRDLQNLLVPKQELPVIPKFVADWYENHRDNLEKQLQGIAYNLDRYGRMPEVSDLDKWINETEYPLQILASLRLGYEVEKEQKYYVLDKEGHLLIRGFSDGSVGRVGDRMKPDLYPDWNKKNLPLTEQEIKDYDKRYWVFAEPVEEVEFRLTF